MLTGLEAAASHVSPLPCSCYVHQALCPPPQHRTPSGPSSWNSRRACCPVGVNSQPPLLPRPAAAPNSCCSDYGIMEPKFPELDRQGGAGPPWGYHCCPLAAPPRDRRVHPSLPDTAAVLLGRWCPRPMRRGPKSAFPGPFPWCLQHTHWPWSIAAFPASSLRRVPPNCNGAGWWLFFFYYLYFSDSKSVLLVNASA